MSCDHGKNGGGEFNVKCPECIAGYLLSLPKAYAKEWGQYYETENGEEFMSQVREIARKRLRKKD